MKTIKTSLKCIGLCVLFTACTQTDNVSDIADETYGNTNAPAETASQKGDTIASRGVTRYLHAQDGPDETAALQSLIDQSSSGDIIFIHAGNHYFSGTVHVNKSGLTIRGANNGTDPTNYLRKTGQGVSLLDIDPGVLNTVIDWIYIDGGNLPEPNMRVFGNQTSIYNSHFRNSDHSGILIHEANLLHIEGVKAYYNGVVGISQWASSDNTIINCQTYENGGEGITIDGGSHNCIVDNVWIYRNNNQQRGVGGIGIDQANGANIRNCTIDQTFGHAIRFQNNLDQPNDGCQVYDNVITGNQGCAISINKPYLVTNFGQWNNTMTGNAGTICYEN